MEKSVIFTLCLIVICNLQFACASARFFPNNGNVKKSSYKLDNRFQLEWQIVNDQVIFEATVETTGFVGLGISPNGGMQNADIFIGGVNDADDTPYHSDRHATGSVTPSIDEHDDYTLLAASQTTTHTYLKFSRKLDTCDSEDYPITRDDTVRLIWAIGKNDTLTYHGADRGSVSLNLFEDDVAPFDPSKYQKWSMVSTMAMPQKDTSYWCSFHKRPPMPSKRHVIAFDAYLPTNISVKHTHHFIVYKCFVPNKEDPDDFFGQWVGHDGEECYIDNKTLPTNYCPEYLFVWAVGGKTTVFPDDVGYAVNENDDEIAYYMLEVHYDNPDETPGVRFDTGVDIYYTDQMRPIEAGLLAVGHDVFVTLTLPPNVTNFVSAGHCASDCTKAAIPEDGINVFNVLLHSHLAGRKLKLRHFRNDVELPWILSDNNYDFNFQQNKALHNHAKIMPGDQMIYECTYDTKWNKGKVVLGGLSTREEMCQTFLWYYPKMEVDVCGSIYPIEENMREFGIANWTQIPRPGGGNDQVIITDPPNLAGLEYEGFLNNNFTWSPQFIAELEHKHRYNEHVLFCAVRSTGSVTEGMTKYPSYGQDYAPPTKCHSSGSRVTVLTVLTFLSSLLCFVLKR